MWRRATGTPTLAATARRGSAVPGVRSDAELIRVPFESQLARRGHVADQRRCGDNDGARQEPFAAQAHAVLPVAVERGDRPLAFDEGIGTLTEARTAPRLPDLSAHRPEHVGDRFAAKTRVGPLDLPANPARSGEDDELGRGPLRALGAR